MKLKGLVKLPPYLTHNSWNNPLDRLTFVPTKYNTPLVPLGKGITSRFQYGVFKILQVVIDMRAAILRSHDANEFSAI